MNLDQIRFGNSLVTVAGLLAALSAAGCGSSDASTSPETGKKYEEILAYDWKIGPAVETYYCVYKTLKEELRISEYRALAPTGTHHVTLGYGDPGPPDGAIASADDPSCTGITLGSNLAVGATRGNDSFTLPEGVAAVIPAGKQLLLSVHVLNPKSSELSGRTGIEIVRADPAKVEHEAEVIFATPLDLAVPPGDSTQKGTCTLDADSTVFALTPHMHLMGKHLTTTQVALSGDRKVLLDQDYDFDAQTLMKLDPPAQFKQGDQIETACTFQNTSANTLTFGESTTANEMCISIAFRYPRVAKSFICAQ
jgi:Copper type II ascorbate-dependent monooxygenase, C-terminal domain